ncbi:MAG: hypothetical protein V4463_12820 [Pseudomonadota bacterium]
MKKLTALILACLMGTASAATPDPVQVKAVHDLLVAMQAEKMVRTTAGMARYPDPKQREAVMAKLAKLTPEEIYTRLAVPVARVVSTETAQEMTRFYTSSYGKRVLAQTYNSGPSLYAQEIVASKAEKADLKKPAYLKADRAFKEAEPAIHHETFLLVSEVAKK